MKKLLLLVHRTARSAIPFVSDLCGVYTLCFKFSSLQAVMNFKDFTLSFEVVTENEETLIAGLVLINLFRISEHEPGSLNTFFFENPNCFPRFEELASARHHALVIQSFWCSMCDQLNRFLKSKNRRYTWRACKRIL